MQVDIPGFQARCRHSATAFSLRPGLTEVTLFGGRPKWRDGYHAKTTVLRFGEFTSVCECDHTHHAALQCCVSATGCECSTYSSRSLSLTVHGPSVHGAGSTPLIMHSVYSCRVPGATWPAHWGVGTDRDS